MTGKARIGAAVIVLLLVSAAALQALDISQGRMKVSLIEGTGRFTVSYMTDTGNSVYKPFLVSNDPRTSMVMVAIGNKVYTLGESLDFRMSVEKTEKGARFLWQSSLIVISEEFGFVTSAGAPAADGISIALTVKNVSNQDLSVAVRMIFDTYLGEASFVHFKTDSAAEITRELTISKAERTAYWASPLVGDPDNFGVICPLTGNGVTRPDRIVFANWKRLTDSSWGYETVPSRNFNLMPYSVNDSAVSHYFDTKPVAKGSEMTITTILGKYNPSGYVVGSASGQTSTDYADTLSTLKAALAEGTGVKDALLASKMDIATIDRLIAYINKRLASSDAIGSDELAALKKIIAELTDRRAAITAGFGK